jgi:hypothetical protein
MGDGVGGLMPEKFAAGGVNKLRPGRKSKERSTGENYEE